MKIKEDYLDTYVSCPLTGKMTYVRTLEPELYNYYFTHGRDFLFEIEIKTPDEKER